MEYLPPWADGKASKPRDATDSLLDKLGELAKKDGLDAKQYYEYFRQTGVIPSSILAAPTPKPPSPTMPPLQLLAARLRLDALPVGTKVTWPNLDYLEGYIKNDVAIIFIVKGGKPLTIEDDPGLFPSDALVTQLRLLMADPAPTK